MTVRLAAAARRRGITLTEILISILILSVGLVSLATLFPIGLLRLREAQRYTRSSVLVQAATADLSSRRLLQKETFINPLTSFWYAAPNVPRPYDPWIQDTPVPFGDWSGALTPALRGAYRGVGGMGPRGDNQTKVYDPANPGVLPNQPQMPGPGLPVAYDPLWWYRMGSQYPPLGLLPWSTAGAPTGAAIVGEEFRFGDGTSLALGDTSGGGTVASLHGLPRLTNMDYRVNVRLANTILSTFVSPEDVVWQEANNTGYADFFDPSVDPPAKVASPSTVIPDLDTTANQGQQFDIANGITPGVLSSYAGTSNDWRYTWMFTGQMADSSGDRFFTGDVVIFENRPFGMDAQLGQVAGERTVQAIFGYGSFPPTTQVLGTMLDGTDVAIPPGSDNSVLLLWPFGVPDPEIKSGSWIADVTYERLQVLAESRFTINIPAAGVTLPPTPAQRCHWYQVQRATAPADTAGTQYAAFGAGRFSLVHTTSKLKARTLWDVTNGVPYHVNAALVSPYVVNVVPRSISLP